jgi:hypothetical protein
MTLLSLYGQKSSLALHRSAGIIGSDHLPNAVSSNVAIGNPVWMDSEMGKSLVGKWWIVQFFVWWHQHLCWSISNHNSHIYIQIHMKIPYVKWSIRVRMFPPFQDWVSIPPAKWEVLQAKWEAIWHERTVLQREVSLRRVVFLVQKSGDFMRTWNSIRKKWGFLQVRQVTSEFRWDHIISSVWLLKLLCYHQNHKTDLNCWTITLWCFGTFFIFHILGIVTPTDFHNF